MRHHLHCGILAAATLAMASASATAANSPLLGIWSGTWPDGQTTELTVVSRGLYRIVPTAPVTGSGAGVAYVPSPPGP